MKLLLPILILFVFSEIAPRAGAQDHSNQPAKRDTAYDEIAQAPAKARAKRNPLESDPEAIAAGRALFEQHCQTALSAAACLTGQNYLSRNVGNSCVSSSLLERSPAELQCFHISLEWG